MSQHCFLVNRCVDRMRFNSFYLIKSFRLPDKPQSSNKIKRNQPYANHNNALVPALIYSKPDTHKKRVYLKNNRVNSAV